MDIIGIERLSPGEIDDLVERGGRFVIYTWTISVIVMTFKRPSNILFIRPGESRLAKGLPYTLGTMVVGWWGIPWGPIHSLGSIFGNSFGGKDVTREVTNTLRQRQGADEARAAGRARATARRSQSRSE